MRFCRAVPCCHKRAGCLLLRDPLMTDRKERYKHAVWTDYRLMAKKIYTWSLLRVTSTSVYTGGMGHSLVKS